MCVIYPRFLIRSTYCNEITSLQLNELVRLISFLRLICLHSISHLPQVISSFVTLPPDRHLPCLLCGLGLILAIQSVNIDMAFVSRRWLNQLILHIYFRHPTHWEKIGHGRVDYCCFKKWPTDVFRRSCFSKTSVWPRYFKRLIDYSISQGRIMTFCRFISHFKHDLPVTEVIWS
jgi:hypothetical protein